MPDDLERLSAYLDNALSVADRSALEARLANDEDLRNELEQLRQTVQTLRSAPELAVPRNFTLDPAKYRRTTPWWARYQRMQMLASFGTAAAILLIAAGILLSRNTLGGSATSTGGAVAMQATTALSEEADKTNEQGASTQETAQRSAASVTSTPAPSMTPVATDSTMFTFATTSTSLPALAANTQQAAQDGAGSAPSETPTETPASLSASMPMATGTLAPPGLAATSAFKSATSAATNLYSPVEATDDSAANAAASGGVAPVAPPTMQPTMVVRQVTQQFGSEAATPTPIGTVMPPAPLLTTATITLAPAENVIQPTAGMLATKSAATPMILPTIGIVTMQLTPGADSFAVTPTPAPTSVPPSQPPLSGSLPMLIIIGIPLLVFCLMMLAIVWLRSRMH